jgi:hypothetical protein
MKTPVKKKSKAFRHQSLCKSNIKTKFVENGGKRVNEKGEQQDHPMVSDCIHHGNAVEQERGKKPGVLR